MTEYQVGNAVRVLPFDEIDKEAYEGISNSGAGYWGISRSFINEMSERHEVLYIHIVDGCIYDSMELKGVPKSVYKLKTASGDLIPYWWTDNMLVTASDPYAESVPAPENADGLFGFLLGKEDSSC